MIRLTKGIFCAVMLLGFASGAGAFSLLGPLKTGGSNGNGWQAPVFGGQPQGLGYGLAGDIGGPMEPTEAYRWNIPVITYAYDLTFLRYFGTNGVAAIEEAMAILNALPPASQMSADLSEYALDTKSENGTASALRLFDIKSFTLATVLEQLGLANPERFVWALRGRDAQPPFFTNYTVRQLNYDPVTLTRSRYVNGVLYNYQIFDNLGPQGGEWASAVEWYQLDPLYQPYSSVAGGRGSSDYQLGSSPSDSFLGIGIFGAGLLTGQFYTGLTRDDVGGLRYLLSTNHMVFDTLPATVLPRTSGSSGSPWTPVLGFGGTNAAGISNAVTAAGTNFSTFVRTAYRPGVDKITFQRVSVFGTNFTPITLRYTDRYISTNGRVVKQSVERLVVQPDILFRVRDIGTVRDIPFRSERSGLVNWINNSALNTYYPTDGLGGPGTIFPPVVITFSDQQPYLINLESGETDLEAFTGFVWGSFDGTTRPPVVYPQNSVVSLEYLQDVVLRRTGN